MNAFAVISQQWESPPMDTQGLGGDLVAAAAVCNIVGRALKDTPSIPNWIIPLALPCFGSLAVCLISGWSGHSAITGFIAGSGAVGFNQAARQVGDEIHRRKTGNTTVIKKD